MSSSFSGALAHRISETSLGVTQTMQMMITEFMPVIVVYTVATTILYRTYPPLAALVGIWAVLFISISFWLAAADFTPGKPQPPEVKQLASL